MDKEVKNTERKFAGKKAKMIVAGVIGVIIAGALITSQFYCKEKNKASQVVQQKTEDNGVIVALIGSEKVSIKELEKIKNAIVQIKDMPMDANIYNRLLDVYLTNRVILNAAKQANLEINPAVQKALEDSRNQILTQAFLNQKLQEKSTNERKAAVYNKMMASYVPEEEIHARHILVDSEKQATDLIVKLKAGAKFEDLANKFSKDNNPNGDNGGDLGYFKKRMMIPEFANAAFAIRAGQISEKPVKTPFGWHVIKVEDRRLAAKPTYNEVAEEVQAHLNEEMIPVIIAEEMQKAQVVKFDPLGLNKAAQQKAAQSQMAQPAQPAKAAQPAQQ